MIGRRGSPTEHEAEQIESGMGTAVGGVGSDDGREKVNVWGVKSVEDGTSVGEVGESERREAEELESIEMRLGMAGGGEKGLKLFELVDVSALAQFFQYVLVLLCCMVSSIESHCYKLCSHFTGHGYLFFHVFE